MSRRFRDDHAGGLVACRRSRLGCAATAAAQAAAGPVIVVETTKGTFAFETYPREAPKTVAHVVALVRRGFYDGQRVHRAIPGFLVQWGDPRSRDIGKGGRLGTRTRGVERQADRRRGDLEEAICTSPVPWRWPIPASRPRLTVRCT